MKEKNTKENLFREKYSFPQGVRSYSRLKGRMAAHVHLDANRPQRGVGAWTPTRGLAVSKGVSYFFRRNIFPLILILSFVR